MTNRLYIFSVDGQKEAKPEAWERRRRKEKRKIQGQTRHVSVWKRKGKGSKGDGHTCMMKYKTTDSNLGSQCAAHHEIGATGREIEQRKIKNRSQGTGRSVATGKQTGDWSSWGDERVCCQVCHVGSNKERCLVAQEKPWRRWVRGYRIEWD